MGCTVAYLPVLYINSANYWLLGPDMFPNLKNHSFLQAKQPQLHQTCATDLLPASLSFDGHALPPQCLCCSEKPRLELKGELQPVPPETEKSKWLPSVDTCATSTGHSVCVICASSLSSPHFSFFPILHSVCALPSEPFHLCCARRAALQHENRNQQLTI